MWINILHLQEHESLNCAQEQNLVAGDVKEKIGSGR